MNIWDMYVCIHPADRDREFDVITHNGSYTEKRNAVKNWPHHLPRGGGRPLSKNRWMKAGDKFFHFAKYGMRLQFVGRF